MLFKQPTRYRRDLLMGPKPAPRKTVLNVKARLNSQRQQQKKQVVVLVSVLMCAVFCGLLLWMLGRMMFFENRRFTLKRVHVDAGKTLSADYIKKRTGLMEGTNMFAVDIRKAREDFMRACPIVRRMDITRVLPSSVIIKVAERAPIARLGYLGSLHIDEEGYVFGQGQQSRVLPIITGSNVDTYKPGVKVEGPALAALQLLNVCSADWHGMIIDSIELKSPKQLDVQITYENTVWKGRLAWDDMGKASGAVETQLAEKLAKMRTVFRTCPPGQAGTFDARSTEVYVQ